MVHRAITAGQRRAAAQAGLLGAPVRRRDSNEVPSGRGPSQAYGQATSTPTNLCVALVGRGPETVQLLDLRKKGKKRTSTVQRRHVWGSVAIVHTLRPTCHQAADGEAKADRTRPLMRWDEWGPRECLSLAFLFHGDLEVTHISPTANLQIDPFTHCATSAVVQCTETTMQDS